jgi:predicted secreted protein
MTDMNRRHIIVTAAGLVTTLSGCPESPPASENTESPPDSPTVTGSPTRSATETETPTEPCERDLKRIRGDWVVETGELEGFTLSVSEQSVPLGGRLTVRLRNRTDELRHTGIKADYDIQRAQETGWQSILRYGNGGWESLAIGHEPGDGYRWELTWTQDGLSRLREDRERPLGPDYHVCVPLEPGAYRFIYFGISVRSGTDYALGVHFTVTDE